MFLGSMVASVIDLCCVSASVLKFVKKFRVSPVTCLTKCQLKFSSVQRV